MATKQRLGADVSHWQTPGAALVDRLKKAGIVFVWVKGSQGARLKDVAYGAHHARLVGLDRGPYHFLDFSGVDAEARNFLEVIGSKTWELAPAMDAEKGNAGSKRATAEYLLRFLELVETGSGRTPVCYVGKPWFEANVDPDPRFARYLAWIPRYPRQYVDGKPPAEGVTTKAPAPWNGPADVWQYSDTRGTLDRNVTTAAILERLTRGHVPIPPEDEVIEMQMTKAELETMIREAVREETNDIRGGIMVGVDEGRKHYGSVRGWVVAVGLAVIGVEKPRTYSALRELAHTHDPVGGPGDGD